MQKEKLKMDGRWMQDGGGSISEREIWNDNLKGIMHSVAEVT
jgi:hypothetical protein